METKLTNHVYREANRAAVAFANLGHSLETNRFPQSDWCVVIGHDCKNIVFVPIFFPFNEFNFLLPERSLKENVSIRTIC